MSGHRCPVHQALVIKRLLSHFRAAASGSALIAASVATHGVEQGELVAAASAEGTALQRIRVLPIGTFTLRDGRGPFTVADRQHAQDIVAASLAYAGNRDIPFDYDHQLLHAVGPGKGGKAEAAGWVKGLTAEDDGIYADVEWTPAASEKLAARAYRYISPTFAFDKASGRVSAIRYGSLVNDNAIDELLAVASTSQETIVDYSKIALALGLDAAASLDDILAAIAQTAGPKQTMTAAAAALGLAETASGDDIVAAASAAAAAANAQPDPAKFVPIETLQDANARLAKLEGDRHDALIAAATEAGKLTPAMEPWARGLLAKDEAAFRQFVGAAPVVVAAGSLKLDESLAGAATLTADELVVARNMSLSPETFAKAKEA
jgi:phage I-like protein